MGGASHSSTRPIARTPLDAWHICHGGRIAEQDGWRLPAGYSSVDHELGSARAGIGAVDVSPFAKVRIAGGSISNACAPLAVDGQIRRGTAVRMKFDSQAIGCQLSDEQFLILGATTNAVQLQSQVSNGLSSASVDVEDVSCALAGIHIIGAATDRLLRRISSLDLSSTSFPPGSCVETNCESIHATVIRFPAGGAAGIRIYIAWDLAEYFWERLLDAGRDLGMTAMGIDAWRKYLAES